MFLKLCYAYVSINQFCNNCYAGLCIDINRVSMCVGGEEGQELKARYRRLNVLSGWDPFLVYHKGDYLAYSVWPGVNRLLVWPGVNLVWLWWVRAIGP
jgi:hypothetical protein